MATQLTENIPPADYSTKFSKHLRTEGERLGERGLHRIIDYVILNEQICGLEYLCFRETTRPSAEFVVKFINTKIDELLDIYVNELCKEVKIVEEILEKGIRKLHLRLVYGEIGEVGTSEQGCGQLVDHMLKQKDRVEDLIDYHRLNMQIVVHLLMKMNSEIDVVEFSISESALLKCLKQQPFNVFFGGLHLVELLTLLSLYADTLHTCCQSHLSADHIATITHLQDWAGKESVNIMQARRVSLQRFIPNSSNIEMKFLKHSDRIVAALPQRVQQSFGSYQPGKLAEARKKHAEERSVNKPKSFGILQASHAVSKSHKSHGSVQVHIVSHHNHEDSKLRDPNGSFEDLSPVSPVPDKNFTRWGSSDSIYEDSNPADHVMVSSQQYFTPFTEVVVKAQEKITKITIKNVWLVLGRTIMYAIFYFGQMPTFASQISYLRIPYWLTGFFFGLAPISAIFADYAMNYLIRRKYRLCFMISLAVLYLAVIVQILAIGASSITLMVFARILMGAAEAGGASNTYLSREVEEVDRVFYGYYYIGAKAIGIVVGCGIAALVGQYVPSFELGLISINSLNIFSVFLLFLYIPCVVIFLWKFKDPSQSLKDQAQNINVERVEVQASKYPFELSVIEGVIFLPAIFTTQKTLQRVLSEDRAKVKEETKHTKLMLAKRYFAKDQVKYAEGYLFILKMVIDACIIDSPYLLSRVYSLSQGSIGLYFFCLIVLLPFSAIYLPQIIRPRVDNAVLLYWSTLAALLATLLRIHFASVQYPLWLFMVLIPPLLTVGLFASSLCLSIITELVSDTQVDRAFGTGFIRAMMSDGGRGLAGIIISIGLAIVGERDSRLNAWTYSISFGCIGGLLLWLNKVKSKIDEDKL